MILLNMFDCFNPVVNGVKSHSIFHPNVACSKVDENIIRKTKELTGLPVAINLVLLREKPSYKQGIHVNRDTRWLFIVIPSTPAYFKKLDTINPITPLKVRALLFKYGVKEVQ